VSPVSDALVATHSTWARLARDTQAALAAYHSAYPLRSGMPREELKSRLGLVSRTFNSVVALAAAQGFLVEAGATVRAPSHEVKFTLAQQARVDELLAACRHSPYGTPLVKDAQARAGDDVYAALLERGDVIQLNEDVFFLRETYDGMVERVKQELANRGKLTVAEVRDLFGASRKYALALMERLDKLGVTTRVGDERVLRAK
jgi:selenocysteine-specific elongation factor